ncbi:MAG: hypothetical protein Q8903_13745 [Bacteroidota bacterium]|nr:hypothetical protein [Bacteroidota bacterium]
MKNILLTLLLFTSFISAQENRFTLPSQKNSMGELSFMVDDPLSDAFLYASKIGLSDGNTVFFAPGYNPTKDIDEANQYKNEHDYNVTQIPIGIMLGKHTFKLGISAGFYQIKGQYNLTIPGESYQSIDYSKSRPIQIITGYVFNDFSIGAGYYNSYKEMEFQGLKYQEIMFGAGIKVDGSSNIYFDYSHKRIGQYFIKSINSYRIEYKNNLSRQLVAGFLGSVRTVNYLVPLSKYYSASAGIAYNFDKWLCALELGYEHNIFKPANGEFRDYFRIQENDLINMDFFFGNPSEETANNWKTKLGMKYSFSDNLDFTSGVIYCYNNSTRHSDISPNPFNLTINDFGITSGINYKYSCFSFVYNFAYHYAKERGNTTNLNTHFTSLNHLFLVSYNF